MGVSIILPVWVFGEKELVIFDKGSENMGKGKLPMVESKCIKRKGNKARANNGSRAGAPEHNKQ